MISDFICYNSQARKCWNRVFFLFLFLYISLFPGTAQINNGSISQKALLKKNKVWMVYGWTFQYWNGVQEKKGKKTSFERFDREGNCTEEIYYDKKGIPYFSCQFYYDDNGFELKRMGGQSDEVIYEKWSYTYSEQGRRVEKKSSFKRAKPEKWVYVFDENKKLLEETYYDATGSISYKLEFLYDEKGNLTEKTERDAYGNLYKKWIYDYDLAGNNIEQLQFVSDGQLQNKYELRYDKKGNIKSKFTLDKNGNVIELTVYIYQFYQGLHAPRTTGNKK